MTIEEQIQNQIYGRIFGTVIRHFLQSLVGILGYYGVNESMQGELLDAAVPLVVSVVIALLTFGWSYAQKKFDIQVKQAALEASPTTKLGQVEATVTEHTVVPSVFLKL